MTAMLSDQQIWALRDLLFFSLPSIAVSIGYWLLNRNEGWLQRLGVSAHGILFSLQGGVAVALSANTGHADDPYALLTVLISIPLLLGIASVIFAFRYYRGKEIVHALQLISIPCAIVVWFISGAVIRHDGP